MPSCEICGKVANYSIFGIHEHHWIKQQQYKKNPEWYEENGLHQKTFDLCYLCHDAIHHSSEKTFLERCSNAYKAKTGLVLKRSDFLFNKKDWLNSAFIFD